MSNVKKYILSLDVSTTTIGAALFEDLGENGKLELLTHISPNISSKIKNPIEKLCLKSEIFEYEFRNKFSGFNIERIIIEEPLLKSNNVSTVASLLRFNGFISKFIYNELGLIPEYISSYDARAYGFPELVKIRTKSSKTGESLKVSKKAEPVLFGDYVLTPTDEYYNTLTDEQKLYYKKESKKGWKLNKKYVVWERVNELYDNIGWLYDSKNELKKEMFDAADAICCGVGFMRKNKIWK